MTEDRDGRAATIRDVAAAAGVSKSLVSLVLRGGTGVSRERREAVRAAMDELGYEPNRSARALAGNGTGVVGILLNDLRNPWYIDLLAGLSTGFGPAAIAPLLIDSATNQRVGRSSAQMLSRQQVDGIVIVGTSGEEAEFDSLPRRIPAVLAGTYTPEGLGGDVAVNDDVAGARQATDHLIALGHRSIAHLSGPDQVGVLRERGYREAMSAAGLDAEIVVRAAGMGEVAGRQQATTLLAGAHRPTGIVAFNDLVAIGALAAAHAAGLSAPDDISIVGYDDTYIAGIERLSLTSIQNGTFEIGERAAEFLLERIRGFDGPRRIHRVPSSLVVRSTSGPVPA